MVAQANIKLLRVDESSELFRFGRMFYVEFRSIYENIRDYAERVTRDVPLRVRENNLLCQQVSEIIKNAAKHGNGYDREKKVKVWYQYSNEYYHIIVEDEGPGFHNLEEWNQFQIKRTHAINSGNIFEIERYFCWNSVHEDPSNGGNSLFAALEYWNRGFYFNNKRNKVAAKRVIL